MVNEEMVVRAFEDKGLALLCLGPDPDRRWLSAVTYFYNSSDKTVTVNLFAYLTN